MLDISPTPLSDADLQNRAELPIPRHSLRKINDNVWKKEEGRKEADSTFPRSHQAITYTSSHAIIVSVFMCKFLAQFHKNALAYLYDCFLHALWYSLFHDFSPCLSIVETHCPTSAFLHGAICQPRPYIQTWDPKLRQNKQHLDAQKCTNEHPRMAGGN